MDIHLFNMYKLDNICYHNYKHIRQKLLILFKMIVRHLMESLFLETEMDIIKKLLVIHVIRNKFNLINKIFKIN